MKIMLPCQAISAVAERIIGSLKFLTDSVDSVFHVPWETSEKREHHDFSNVAVAAAEERIGEQPRVHDRIFYGQHKSRNVTERQHIDEVRSLNEAITQPT